MGRFVLKLSIFCLLSTLFCLTGCRKNKAPDVKTPWGLSDDRGFVDIVYTFITDAVDPEDEDVAFKFNWGDGSESGWSNYIASGETYYIKHSYSTSGVYLVKAKAKDIHNNESDWSSPYKITIVAKSLPPESLTVWANVDTVCLGNPVTLYFRAVDSEGDSIKYVIYWDDKERRQDTTRLYASGVVGKLSYTYVDTVEIGVREVKVMAVDNHGSASDWSAPCSIIVQPPPPPKPPATPQLLETYSVYYLQTPFSFRLTPCDSGIYYQFIWGDGDSSAWALGEVLPGGTRAIKLPHPFRKAGICSVTAVAKDKYGQISDPSAPCEITITNNFITEWSKGLSKPLGGVFIDDKLYVVDYNNHCIREFTLEGNPLRELGKDILHQPMYVDGDYEYIYVTDASDTVYKINRLDGSLVMKWGGYGSWEGKFDFPTGIAIDTGYVYVVDAQNKRVQKFTKDGVIKAVWNLPDKAMGMSISGDTVLFVACNYRNVLYLFNTEGVLKDSIGTTGGGSADGQFLGLCAVAVHGDYVYVADTENHRVQVFTTDGRFVIRWGTSDAEDEEFGTRGQFNKPQGIAVDSSGNIYVIDTLNDRVQKFAPISKGGVL